MKRKFKPPILRKDKGYRPFKRRNDATPGWVYIFRMVGTNEVKIGLSRNPKERKSGLQSDYGQLITIALIWTFNMLWLENLMHDQYNDCRVHQHPSKSGYTEWFRLKDAEEIMEVKTCLFITAFFVNSCYVVFAFVIFIMSLLLLWSIVN